MQPSGDNNYKTTHVQPIRKKQVISGPLCKLLIRAKLPPTLSWKSYLITKLRQARQIPSRTGRAATIRPERTISQ